jgi:hypothetical protein
VLSFTFDIDIVETVFYETPIVTQYDDNITFIIRVTNKKQPYSFQANWKYKLVSKRVRDDRAFYVDGTKTGDNEITFVLGKAETAFKGQVICAVQIFDELNNRTTTSQFGFTVKGDIGLENVVPSPTDKSALELVVQNIDTILSGGIISFDTLVDLQAAYPNGLDKPVWIKETNGWYYWVDSGSTTPTNPTPPITPTIVPFYMANSGATISYSANNGQRGGGVLAKVNTTITKVGVKGGASGAWSIWKLDNTTFNIVSKITEGTTLSAPDANGYRLSNDISVPVVAGDNLLIVFTYATGIDSNGTYRFQTGASATSDSYFAGNNRIINSANGVPVLNDITSTGFTYDTVIYHT